MSQEAVVEQKAHTSSAAAFLFRAGAWLLRLLGVYAAIALIVLGSVLIGVALSIGALVGRGMGQRMYRERARRVISRSVRFYLWVLEVSGLMKLEYRGFEQIDNDTPVLFVANHPSLWDVLFFIAKFPTATCIVKPYLARYSPYALCIYWADYIVAKRDVVLECARQEFIKGNSLVVFPEGTRSDAAVRQSGEVSLQRGAAAIALRCEVPMHIVSISCVPAALGKRQAWYQIPDRKCQVRLVLSPALDLREYREIAKRDGDAIATRALTAALESQFSTKSSQMQEP